MSEDVEKLKEFLSAFVNLTKKLPFDTFPKELSKYVGEGGGNCLDVL